MTIAEAPAGGSTAIFDLIAPFSESADARLRGNAVQALAVLVGGPDKSLRQQAMDEIVRVVSAESSGSGALDWQRRFVARCLDAFARLQPAERQMVGQQILTASSGTREPERRAAIARLSLAAMAHDRRLWTANWIRWLLLARLASRSGFWITVWAVLWRTTVVWGILALVAEFAPVFIRDETFSDDLFQHAVGIGILTAIILTISTLLSVSGSIRPPISISIADSLVSAATFALLIIIPARTGDASDLSVRDVLPLSVVGFVLGAALRTLRWGAIVVATEPNATATVFRPLTAVGVATLVCIFASRLGMDMRAAAIGWMILAPAAMISTWLDVWLENTGPHPLSQERPRKEWAMPVFAGSAILLSGWLVHANFKQAPALDAEVRVPGTSGPIPADFGHQIPVNAEIEGMYQIVANANPNEQITLFLIQGTSDQHLVSKSSGDQLHPPSITEKLKKDGKYFVCVMPGAQLKCSLSTVADFDMLVINGKIWRELDISAAHTINISPMPSQ